MSIMKAVGYFDDATLLDPGYLLDLDIEVPTPRPHDLLVQVKAVAINPVDFKARCWKKPENERPVILGWDASGIVSAVGSAVKGFAAGDEVYYAGDLTRDGCNAEYQTVDHRIAAKKPVSLSFAEAASLPLTSLTAYEGLFEKLCLPRDTPASILFIGGAGGVGSIGIQLVKALTEANVYATAGRPESRKWLESLGVDGVIDRTQTLKEGLEKFNQSEIDYVFSTTHTSDYLPQLAELIRPFGSLCLIDDPKTLDIMPLKLRSIGVLWELMFTKSMFGYRMETRGKILAELAQLVDAGKVMATAARVMEGLSADNFTEAHRLQESGTAIAKTVIAY